MNTLSNIMNGRATAVDTSNEPSLSELNINKWKHEDSIDPNKDNMFPTLSVEQRDFLKASISSMPGYTGNWRENHFGQIELVEDLKKNPLFNDKRRLTLWNLLKTQSQWIDKQYFQNFHPEQEDFLRTCIMFLDDCGWRDSTGKKISHKRAAEELSKFYILSDKTVYGIYQKISHAKKWW